MSETGIGYGQDVLRTPGCKSFDSIVTHELQWSKYSVNKKK